MFPARLGVQHPQDRPGLRRLPAAPVRPTLGLQEAGLGVGAAFLTVQQVLAQRDGRTLPCILSILWIL